MAAGAMAEMQITWGLRCRTRAINSLAADGNRGGLDVAARQIH